MDMIGPNPKSTKLSTPNLPSCSVWGRENLRAWQFWKTPEINNIAMFVLAQQYLHCTEISLPLFLLLFACLNFLEGLIKGVQGRRPVLLWCGWRDGGIFRDSSALNAMQLVHKSRFSNYWAEHTHHYDLTTCHMTTLEVPLWLAAPNSGVKFFSTPQNYNKPM